MSKKISFVLPIYNESGNIPKLHLELKNLSKKLSAYNLEFIYVNDGSSDKSLALLNSLLADDKRVVIIDFARNYGHQLAVTAGIEHATGDAVIIMDADLQDPPKVCLELVKKWEQGFNVVYAQRRSRKDSFLKKLTASIFYKTLHKLADINIPKNTGDFRLIDRAVVDELAKYGEHARFLRGMISYIGFEQVAVPFDRDERHSGQTGYTVKKMLKLASDGIFSFSIAPLKLVTGMGLLFSGVSFIGILYTLFVKIAYPAATVEGWAFIVICILLVGGVQLTMLGVIGGYIGRIYTEVQNRPLYGIKKIHRAE